MVKTQKTMKYAWSRSLSSPNARFQRGNGQNVLLVVNENVNLHLFYFTSTTSSSSTQQGYTHQKVTTPRQSYCRIHCIRCIRFFDLLAGCEGLVVFQFYYYYYSEYNFVCVRSVLKIGRLEAKMFNNITKDSFLHNTLYVIILFLSYRIVVLRFHIILFLSYYTE